MKPQSTILSTKQRPIDPPDSIFWMGMDRLRASCLGIKLVEIGAFFPDERALLTPREAARAEGMSYDRMILTVVDSACERLNLSLGNLDAKDPKSTH